ncbi:hypothetical protein [Jeotgalibaca ciconiae]|uniref:Uncharacterized protein n=1 Tax=Jeotgalibaca ciconiae TaxID=2496265 RepID=A0A3S9H7H6_9LACT|nr:hypothetical protein [Jeotgalibaca ciconiae]AZP03300.1 hypothetical protein EJN90_00685 [Jeotgalibaca ciconiae]HJB23371.1 hypothetical protein [Candidatus Jeotgalibaca pullicola]
MKPELYLAYQEWRNSMLDFQEDLAWDEAEEADFAVWDAADHHARDDFNLFLASKALDQVSFQDMKAMEIQYDAES